MTTAFAALLLGVVGAALLLAIFAYVWVNRTPPAQERFDEHGRVPLFGVDLAAGTARMTTPATAPRAASPSNARQKVANTSVPVAAHDAATDVVSDEHAIEGEISASPPSNEREVEIRQFTTFARPASGPTPSGDTSPSPEDVTSSADGPGRERDLRPGWGAQPGWPVSPAASLPVTPRYNAPIAGPPSRSRQTPLPPPSNGNGHYAGANGVFNGVPDSVGPGVSRDRSRNTPPHGNGYLDAAANGDLSQIPGAVTDGHSVRYATPAEGTLQFLPGRLEISSGLDTGREIRFVRSPGPNGTEVTFGRNEGPIYRHIQLRDQTVSREHARMEFAEGQWTLTNLSRTNPVAHNGRILRHSEEQQLIDGDRLEMGEVIFSFRSR